MDNINKINTKAKKSMKWSLLAEIFAKFATPLVTIILARLLSPESYGIATAVVIVVSFCELVSESGIAKYLIQRDFDSEEEYHKTINSSFTLTLIVSLLLCFLCMIFSHPLSAFLGNKGHESVLLVSSIQIPIASLNALLVAILRRSFDFKKIFLIKMIVSLAPFFITVPLAFLGFGYWSLVIGTLTLYVIQLPILLFANRKINIKPSFDLKLCLQIFKKASPMILESFVIWACTWSSTIIAANLFSQHIVGIVKVSNSTVENIFSLFSSAFLAVLFPALSRLKQDKNEYRNAFYSIQESLLCVVLPLGIGGFVFAQTITDIFLGSQWSEATFVIALFCLTKPLVLTTNHLLSEVFRSKGHFYKSIVYQITTLLFYLLIQLTIGRFNFTAFIICGAVSHMFITVLSVLLLKKLYNFSIRKEVKMYISLTLCCMGILVLSIPRIFFSFSFAQSLFQIIVLGTSYVCLLYIFKKKSYYNALTYIGVLGEKHK